MHLKSERIVSMTIKLKELERKAYTSYYSDGLLEIFTGVTIILIGVAFALDAAHYFAIVPVLSFISWAGAKRALTVPRMGHVKFGPERQARMAREKSFFLIYFTITFVLGIVVFFIFSRASQSPVRDFFRIAPLGPIGILGAIALAFLGYWKEIRRLYFYAALVIIAVFGGPALDLFPIYYLGAPGLLILVIGIVMLARFIQRYPKTEEEADDETT
jgi:hypothetical protein